MLLAFAARGRDASLNQVGTGSTYAAIRQDIGAGRSDSRCWVRLANRGSGVMVASRGSHPRTPTAIQANLTRSGTDSTLSGRSSDGLWCHLWCSRREQDARVDASSSTAMTCGVDGAQALRTVGRALRAGPKLTVWTPGLPCGCERTRRSRSAPSRIASLRAFLKVTLRRRPSGAYQLLDASVIQCDSRPHF